MLTFRKEAGVAIVHVPAQEPPIAKVIVPLNQFYAVTLGQAQFVGAPSDKIVDD